MTTPGPWEAVERIDGYWEVRGDHADCAEGVPLRQEDDVRLMARAPDLLAALATARAEGFREGWNACRREAAAAVAVGLGFHPYAGMAAEAIVLGLAPRDATGTGEKDDALEACSLMQTAAGKLPSHLMVKCVHHRSVGLWAGCRACWDSTPEAALERMDRAPSASGGDEYRRGVEDAARLFDVLAADHGYTTQMDREAAMYHAKRIRALAPAPGAAPATKGEP